MQLACELQPRMHASCNPLCACELQPCVSQAVPLTHRCDSLNRKKDANTLAILEHSYSDIDLFFVQEAAAVFVAKTHAATLGRSYAAVSSSFLDGKRDQNSLVLLNRQYFDVASVRAS